MAMREKSVNLSVCRCSSNVCLCLLSTCFNPIGAGSNKYKSNIFFLLPEAVTCTLQILLAVSFSLPLLVMISWFWWLPTSLMFSRRRDFYGISQIISEFTWGKETSCTPVGKLVLSVLQVGVWTYWCVKMAGCLVIAGIHHPPDSWQIRDAAFPGVDSSLLAWLLSSWES